MKKNVIPTFSDEQYKIVNEKFNPQNSKACNNNLLWGNNSYCHFSGEYHGFSFKRSNLNNVYFENSEFDHCNFTGSILNCVEFKKNCQLTSVNFMRSKLYKCLFESDFLQHALNFSSCVIEETTFTGNSIRGSFFNNAKLNNCKFINQKIISTSFDNCHFQNCLFENCNIKNLNLEFATFENVILNNVQVSFYQLPYIIGVFSNLNNFSNVLLGCGKGKTISFKEYYDNIQDSIIYFTGLNQYLPLANLYYLKKDYHNARSSIFLGIEDSLLKNDYPTIKYLIRLAVMYDLINYQEIHLLFKKIDESLANLTEDLNYRYYLQQSYEIQSDLKNIINKSVLDIKIETTLNNDQFEQASKICQDIDDLICNLSYKTEHNFKISHNSPITIVLSVIGLTGDLITISSLIYKLIEKNINKKKKISNKKYEIINKINKSFINDIDNEIDSLKNILLRSKKSEQEEIISNFRSKILAKIGDKIDTDTLFISTEEVEN